MNFQAINQIHNSQQKTHTYTQEAKTNRH